MEHHAKQVKWLIDQALKSKDRDCLDRLADSICKNVSHKQTLVELLKHMVNVNEIKLALKVVYRIVIPPMLTVIILFSIH
jgi:hypothetical protein